jgi:hypothetical protein
MATDIIVGVNAYVDVDTAEAYIEGNFGSSADWLALSFDEKSQTLISASRLIDQQYAPFVSMATSPTQKLAFPRKTFYYTDPILGYDIRVESDEIPPLLEIAVSDLAVHLASNKETLFGGESTIEWSSLTLDSLSISRSPGSGPIGSKRVSLFPYSVAKLMESLTVPTVLNRNHWWRTN